MTAIARLKPGRERSLLRRHPWVFSGAIASLDGTPDSGETVQVRAAGGEFLGSGAWSPASQIRVRMWTFDPHEEVGPELLARRLERAVRSRTPVSPGAEPAARRLVNAESDLLPGLIIDRYGRFLVCQFLSAGAEQWRAAIVAALTELPSLPTIDGIWERSDTDARDKEGLVARTGLLWGVEPPARIEVREDDVIHLADLRRGHKTGLYLDQRENRAAVAARVGHGALQSPTGGGAEVLNCFAYNGGFGHAALAAGAGRVTHVESSGPALELLRSTAAANGFAPDAVETVEGNVFSVLRGFRAEERRFDAVILDPPKFAESRRRLEAAARGYKDINLLALQLLRPGGILATFSCSGVMEPDLFQKIVADAALDAGRDARILCCLAQADDHPVALPFPEGKYLKGLICRVW